METTRHFTASVYVINDGATVLHRHDALDLWLPPGGHLKRDELPHVAAIREVGEETGLPIELLCESVDLRSDTSRPIPAPETILLEDITVSEDGIAHQHIDFIYYGIAPHRQITPRGGDEAPSDRWRWFTIEELKGDDRFDPDVRALGVRAIQTVAAR